MEVYTGQPGTCSAHADTTATTQCDRTGVFSGMDSVRDCPGEWHSTRHGESAYAPEFTPSEASLRSNGFH